MNILTCNYKYPPLGGGGGVTTKRLAEELAKKHAVSVLTSAFGDLPKCEVVNHVTIYGGPILGRNCTQTASLLSMLLYWPASLLKGLGCVSEKPSTSSTRILPFRQELG